MSNQRQRKVWLARIRRDVGSEFVLSSTTKICSAHFVDTDFAVRGKRRFFKEAAMPSVFPWTVFHVQSSTRVSEASTAPIVLPSYASSRGSAESAADYCDETCKDETHTQEGTPNHNYKFQRKLEELQLQNERLQSQNENLLPETHSLAHQLRQKEAAPPPPKKKNMISLANIKSSNNLVEFYTGFQDYKTLLARSASYRCSSNFFMTLVRLRLGLLERNLAHRFNVSQSTVCH